MSNSIIIETLTSEAFAPFGDVIDATGTADKLINQGRCARFHDRAALDFTDGRAGVSLFKSELATLPLTLPMMERHPAGSQTFIPMSSDPFLVVVAEDDGGTPTHPRAFMTVAAQAVNFHRGTWHGVLTPLSGNGIFAVLDRIGGGANLEEHWFEQAFIIDT